MKRMYRITCVLVASVAMFSYGASQASANLLSNASFESPLEYGDANIPNWFAFFGAGSTGTFSTSDGAYTGTIMPSDGSHHLSITNDGTANGFSGVLQRVPAVPGLDYTFSFEAKSNSGPSFPLGAEYRIEWIDATDTVIGATPNMPIAGLLTESYQSFDITGTAPAGTNRAVPVIAVETFSASGTPADLFVDNSSFTLAIPEPASLALFGFGLAGLTVGVRRRK